MDRRRSTADVADIIGTSIIRRQRTGALQHQKLRSVEVGGGDASGFDSACRLGASVSRLASWSRSNFSSENPPITAGQLQ